MKTINIKQLAYASVAALLFAACASDELADGTVQDLPEGKYPLQISSVTMSAESTAQPWGANAPQTRVKEDDSRDNSVWETNDEIRVGIDGYSDSDSKIYRMTVSNGTVTVSPSSSPVYWKNKDAKYVMACYPADGTVALDNQTNKLAYALFAKTEGTVDYNTTTVSLPFQHKLAKVRVMLTGDKMGDVTEVKIETLTSCTLGADGTLTNGSTKDFIPMMKTTYNNETCWEANVVPSNKIEKVKVNNVECTLDDKGITPVMAAVNTMTITVKEKAVEVNVSNLGTGYTVNGNVLLKGNGTEKELNITMEAGSKLTLDNVKLKASWGNNAITCKGNSTITLKGDNTLSGDCAIRVEGGTLIIMGNDNDKLTATGTGHNYNIGAGIGAINEANITIEGGHIIASSTDDCTGIGSAGDSGTCGTITINGGIINSKGGHYSAGIGGGSRGACGDIIITGGNVKAYGGLQSPGIGNGDSASCGSITISGASTVVYAKKSENGKSPESIGWNNYNGSCGTVTIGAECHVTQE